MSEGAPDPSAALRGHDHVHWDPASFDGPAARRIVSLVPSLSEALEVLELGERLVGVTEYCVHPAGAFDALPKLGGTKDADVAAIAALAPDLVIANQEENTPRVVRALADLGIDVWVTYPRNVGEGVALLEDLARLGAPPAALARWVEPARAAFDTASARRAAASGARPSVFCPIWRDPVDDDQPGHLHPRHDRAVWGRNLFAEPPTRVRDAARGEATGDRRYPIVDLEAVVAAGPEVVLLPDEPYAFGEADREMLLRLDLPASRAGRIHLIDGTLVSWYGPRIAEAIRVLAEFLANP